MQLGHMIYFIHAEREESHFFFNYYVSCTPSNYYNLPQLRNIARLEGLTRVYYISYAYTEECGTGRNLAINTFIF